MITLEKISQKLNRILNGITTDSADTGESWLTQTAPTTNEYNFAVKTNGFHLDKINENNKNLIFVFVDSLGGEINNVKSLKEIDYNTEITFYYPVRFKDDFYAINDFLYNTFVEQFLNFGTSANKDICLTAMSVAQYGEIATEHLQELTQFINNNYPIQVAKLRTEMYMSMTFTLYLSTINGLNQSGGLLFGNSWNTSLNIYSTNDTRFTNSSTSSLTANETKVITSFISHYPPSILGYEKIDTSDYSITIAPKIIKDGADYKVQYTVHNNTSSNQSVSINFIWTYTRLVDDNPIFITETNISNSEPIAEQVLGNSNSKGVPVSSSYTKELPIYVKNNNDYKWLINQYLNRNLENLIVSITEENTLLSVSSNRLYYITNMSMVKAKGEMLGITLTLAERID